MNIEIWSDVVCPWCYIGKRRFERALEQFPQRDQVQVVWRSFELDPTAPAARSENPTQRLASKYGVSLDQARGMQARVTNAATQDGLTFDLEHARSGNTFDAHRLLHLAREHGVQDALKERLFRGYFSENQAIGERETLVALAGEVGLAPEAARDALEGGAYAAEVRADEREAAELGISSVPFFVFERRYGVSGAQPSEVLLGALEQAWSEGRRPVLTAIGADGAVCTDDTCAT